MHAVAIGARQARVAPVGASNPDERATCDGSNIRYCRAGRPRTYSCTALGFRACDSGKNGVRCVM